MGKWTGKWTLVVALWVILAGNALAQEAPRQTVNLKVGGSEVIITTHPVKRATVADSLVADIVVLSPREFYAFGKKVGYTSVILWEEGAGRTLLDVVVSLDLTALKEKLHELFPDEKVMVHASETGVLLSGRVSGPDVMEQVLRLTRTYLPTLAQGDKAGKEGTGKSGAGITNLLKIDGIQQVLLEVKFAEVTRDSAKDWQAALGIENLGNSLRAAAGTSVLGVNGAGDLNQSSGSVLLNMASSAALGVNPANIFLNIDDVTTALNFLEKEGLAKTLAEPRLVTQSGQEASFLAGGEYPVPVAQDVGEITIEFKEFGVSLNFTPVVLSDGRINLRVAPSVSEISSVSTIPVGLTGLSYTIPNLSTRKLETTVQLYDGQTLALAGLLQDSLREDVKKIPWLGDLPILGALFRSTSFRDQKTDLLIAVTPHLVKPVREGALNFPGEFMQLPDPYEFYLEGRLEGDRVGSISNITGHDFSAVGTPGHKRGGLEGDFGHEKPM
jgi:pilus assembly protein CpaC